jgi:hypothetical protein
MKKVTATIVLALALTACGKETASFDSLELARSTAKSNAEYNLQKFRGSYKQYAGYALETSGDSTQTAECPQGDGWASQKMVDLEAGKSVKVKCSTVSASVGCMTQTDFDTKPYAADDGQCQDVSKVPYPIPKIAK